MSEVLFNEGEGLTHGDLNAAQRLINRGVFQEMEYHRSVAWPPSAAPATDLIRTFGQGLAPFVSVGDAFSNVVGVRAGACLWVASAGAPGAEDYEVIPCALAEDLTFDLGAAPVSSSKYAIIYGKATRADGAAESRDFEDAATHAVTSQNTNTRRLVTLDIQHAISAEGGAVPAVPEGYAKLGQFTLLPSTGINSYLAWQDHRKPAGGHGFLSPLHFGLVGATPWATMADGPQRIAATAASQNAWLPLVGEYGINWGARRLARIKIACQLTTGFSAYLIQVKGQHAASSTYAIQTVTTQITAGSAGVYTITPTNPVWAGGGYQPGEELAAEFDATAMGGLYLKIVSGASGDWIRSVCAEWWGY